MFKRATWLGVGFTIGVGTTVVAARKARQQLDRYKPPAVVDRVTTSITDKASSLRAQVTEALADGKQAAKDREQELREPRTPRPRGAENGSDFRRRPVDRDPARRATPTKEACRGSVE